MDRGGAGLLSADIEHIRAHLDRGAPWDACDAFRQAFGARGEDAEFVYWGALAHARAGATKAAHSLLDRCDLAALSAALRVEALSLRGRLWKDALHRTRDAHAAARFVRRARAQYLLAYRIAHDAYPGVNAATLAMVEGDRPGAIALAREVAQALDRRDESVWSIATRAEARLLVGEIDAAASDYAVACERALGHAGVVAAIRRQLALLARVLPRAAELLSLLPSPDVVAFAGHLIDDGGRQVPRFPPSLIPRVREALDRRVAAMRQPVVFSSAACGADLLFVEAALAKGAEVNVVLPFARDDFLRTSVAVGGDEWVGRFGDALARASRVIMATDEQYLGDDILFEHAALLVEGFARLRAAQLETSPCMLCVIDPQDAGDVGGTRSSYDRWKATGDPLHFIDLRALRDGKTGSDATSPGRAGSGPTSRAALPRATARAWKALLFADFAGFSRVQDAFAPRFHERFLDLCARAIAHSPAKPLDAKTWGDALYAVFDTAHEAADFALRFLDSTLAVDWSQAGMTQTSGVRIALHAGPVFRGYDPVMKRDDFFGSSVTRAARIEPIAQPGTVYASEAFAATLASQRGHRFTLEYIGRVPLAKAYGESTVYRVDRA
jgi:class 3 adenylate cyclase